MLPLEMNLSGQWSTFWSALTTAIPGLGKILSIVALLVFIAAAGKFIWDKRDGIQAGEKGRLHGGVLVAIFLATPQTLLPLALKLIDFIGNFFINLLSATLR